MSAGGATELTANWDRAIFIDSPINDQLVRQLMPSILRLRQESSEPITVAIDSPGGSLAALDTLLGLLTGPTQSHNSGSIITVATNKAYSAAANFLAFGTYAVGLEHAKILFHDVRFSELEDVTPSKARDVAKSLQDENDRYALRLANHIIRRLVWVLIDLKSNFAETTKRYPRTLKRYQASLGKFASPVPGRHFVDIASFATMLFANLSKQNEGLINGVMDRLGKWVILTQLADSFPTYRAKGSKRPGLLDGARALNKLLTKKADCFTKVEGDTKLLFTLLIAELSDANGPLIGSLDVATRNFILIQSMSDEKHQRSAMRLMLRHNNLFLGKSIKDLTDAEKNEALEAATPYAQLFWLFCVSLCRELFEGEHVLSPDEGQLLGLLDEVAGGGVIESRREFRINQAKETAGEAEAAAAQVGTSNSSGASLDP